MKNCHLCENCLYFQQHYYIGMCKLHKVNYGLCRQNLKNVTPTDITNCEYFTPKIEEIEKQNNNKLAIDVLKCVENALIDLKIYLEHQN